MKIGRPKIKEEDKKFKLGITIDNEVNDMLNEITNNKSYFINNLIKEYYNKKVNKN